ncbi:hypothetical protein PMIN06_012302 [Paraphaeosphaeria minitans]
MRPVLVIYASEMEQRPSTPQVSALHRARLLPLIGIRAVQCSAVQYPPNHGIRSGSIPSLLSSTANAVGRWCPASSACDAHQAVVGQQERRLIGQSQAQRSPISAST